MAHDKKTALRLGRCAGAAAILLLSPAVSMAFSVTSLAPGWLANPFATIAVDTRAIALDETGDLYVLDRATNVGGNVEIMRLQAPAYTSSFGFASYTTTDGCCANGLAFAGADTLYVSVRTADRNAGQLDAVDTGTRLASRLADLPDFRPAGIGVDSAGDALIAARLQSDSDFGQIARLVPDPPVSISVEIPDTIATAVAVSATDDILVAIRDDPLLTDDSLYRFPSDGGPAQFIARFDSRPDALTADLPGHIYAVAAGASPGTSEILKLSPRDLGGLWQVDIIPVFETCGDGLPPADRVMAEVVQVGSQMTALAEGREIEGMVFDFTLSIAFSALEEEGTPDEGTASFTGDLAIGADFAAVTGTVFWEFTPTGSSAPLCNGSEDWQGVRLVPEPGAGSGLLVGIAMLLSLSRRRERRCRRSPRGRTSPPRVGGA